MERLILPLFIAAVFATIAAIFWALMFTHLLNKSRMDSGQKTKWMWVLLITNVLGAAAYYFVAYRRNS